MSTTINIGNHVIVLDAIAAIEHKDQSAQVIIAMKAGNAYTFSFSTAEEAKKTLSTLKMAFSEAGYGAIYVTV